MSSITKNVTEPEKPATWGPWQSLRLHWPEYAIEGAALGTFMISACLCASLLQSPGSPVRQALPDDHVRQMLMGLAMGLTLLAIVYSPWGQRSGAHMNPALTFNFYLLGKVKGWDAVFYVLGQFLGGISGVGIAWWIGRTAVSEPPVHYIVTSPGPHGPLLALAAEFVISGILMYTVLSASNSRRFARWTPVFAATLVTLYIGFPNPFSAVSMNPARSTSSAFWAHQWDAIWIYFLAPPLGMLVAGFVYRKQSKAHQIFCAKLHHHNHQRCIFNCNYGALGES